MPEYTLFYVVQRHLVAGWISVTVIHRYTLPRTQVIEPYLTQANVRAVKQLVLARELLMYANNIQNYLNKPDEEHIQYIGSTQGHQTLERLDE